MTPRTPRAEFRRLLVFTAVGTANTAICYALYAALVHFGNWHHHAALAADYAFGIVTGYALHRAATFADRAHTRRAFGKYTVTLLLTFAANFVLLDMLVRSDMLGPLAAQAAAMVSVTLVSYAAQKHWVFRSHGASPPPDSAAPQESTPHEDLRRVA